MRVVINKDALDLTFRAILTCQCPVTAAEEKAVFDVLVGTPDGGVADYGTLLGIFKPNSNNVLRRVHDFSTWLAPVDVDPFVITRDHVIRYFASTFHWNHVVAEGMSGAYKKVLYVPSWFIAHMLVPARVIEVGEQAVHMMYEWDGGQIELRNLFAPRGSKPAVGEVWGVHFAALLDRLTPEEERLTRMLNDVSPLLIEFRADVDRIDYLDFHRFGNYLAFCTKRYETYFE